MSFRFNRTIPGQSLTLEPKSRAYERPPQITNPLEALDTHLDRLTNEDVIDDVLYFLEYGADLVTVVQGILRSAVMEGVHSIDVSLIIAPVIHEHIKGFADAAGIEYDEGFNEEKQKKALTYARDKSRTKELLKKLREEEDSEEPEGLTQEMPMHSEMHSEMHEEMPQEEPEMEAGQQEPAQTGLMARTV